MKKPDTVVLDACVLIPMPLADTLLRLAAGPHLYIPKWSDQIMEEVSRTLRDSFGLSREKARYREREIRRHFPEAWIEGYERRIASMTNHPKDRHVLAAAVHARAGTVLTFNTKDFPHSSLAPYRIKMEVLEAQAAAIGETLQYVLFRLRVNVPEFVAVIE